MSGVVWFWIGGGLAAGVLTAWVKWLALWPRVPRWTSKLFPVPFVVLGLSVGVAAYFTWKSFHDVKAADASEKASLMAQNISWAMNATLVGIIGLVLFAVLLAVLTLRRFPRA